jgi:hypothetical protein
MHSLKNLILSLIALIGAGVVNAAEPALAPDTYQIRNKAFGELLRPEDANSANGTPIVLYPAQSWKCMTWRFHAADESAFSLQNLFTSKTFAPDAKGDAAQPALSQVPFGKEAASRPGWRFTKLADGTYRIQEAGSERSLTAVRQNGGYRIQLQPWKESAEQKWSLEKIDAKSLTM